MRISVIIPAYNEEKRLPATLTKINAALAIVVCKSEVIVVDNESTDETASIAINYGAKVFAEIEHNIGRVRNVGARNASGDVLVFVDADTLVPETLFEIIVEQMIDEKCFGGAAAVEYEDFERRWMRWYLRGWKFWERFFELKQGATQFCRKTIFDELGGYDETIYMGEDVMFYRHLAKYAKQKGGHLYFIENPKVKTSARRFDRMSVWKTLLLTHPLFIIIAAKRKRFWSDWYENVIR